FTSNDWSVKKMKKNWRRLHQLTYTALFLLFWHIQEKMSDHWNILTPIELIAMTIITALFLKRRWLEYRKEYEQQAKKQII
ncbi:MAG: iron reductase, partial [Nostocales cyanobacterium W4_Combined_metabat2_030]|nr:iron reductase [Nostocales cyanobacterium W4_Combined_metabat2_030]